MKKKKLVLYNLVANILKLNGKSQRKTSQIKSNKNGRYPFTSDMVWLYKRQPSKTCKLRTSEQKKIIPLRQNTGKIAIYLYVFIMKTWIYEHGPPLLIQDWERQVILVDLMFIGTSYYGQWGCFQRYFGRLTH